MQPISWCVYCHSSCEFVVVFSVFTVVECASFCANQSLLLHFFISFFFFSWVDQSSVVIKPSQGAGWWWSVLADFFCCSEAIFFVLALSFYVDGTNSWLFECWFLMLIVRGLVDCCCLQARTLLSGELSAECTSYHVKAKLGSASDVTPSSFSLTWLHDEKVNEKVNVSSKKVKAGSCEAVLPSPRSYGNRRHAFFLFNF